MVKLAKKKRDKYAHTVMENLQEERKEAFRDNFLTLHPSDQSDVFMKLDREARAKAYTYLMPEEFSDVFENLYIRDQMVFFLELDEDYASDMFNKMFTDDVVDFLSEINEHYAEEIIERMDEQKAAKVQAILQYAHETAGAIMTKELIQINAEETVDDVMRKLRNEAPSAEIIYYLYVVDTEKALVGVVSLRELITAPPSSVIKDVMQSDAVSVVEDMDQEEVGRLIQKYDLLAIPVVSKENHLLGIVTVDDVMDILEEETTEDFGEISATKGATDVNLGVFTAAKKRAPWIIALMFFGLITGGVIDQFEETLQSVVLLAAFIPMIMDSGGNVGTQSLAVSVRGLAVGSVEKKGFWGMIGRELSTGAMIGLFCMIVIAVLISLLHGNIMLGVIVGTSILITLSLSAVIGAVIPLVINKMNIDPAVASGPFITTLNDIIGLLIYFSIATSLLDYL